MKVYQFSPATRNDAGVQEGLHPVIGSVRFVNGDLNGIELWGPKDSE